VTDVEGHAARLKAKGVLAGGGVNGGRRSAAQNASPRAASFADARPRIAGRPGLRVGGAVKSRELPEE